MVTIIVNLHRSERSVHCEKSITFIFIETNDSLTHCAIMVNPMLANMALLMQVQRSQMRIYQPCTQAIMIIKFVVCWMLLCRTSNQSILCLILLYVLLKNEYFLYDFMLYVTLLYNHYFVCRFIYYVNFILMQKLMSALCLAFSLPYCYIFVTMIWYDNPNL